jgi:hypothetical protein
MFAALDNAKPVTENIRRLNLAVVKHMTVQVVAKAAWNKV